MSPCRRWIGYAGLLLLPAVLLLALPAAAKGPVDKITIGGPALESQIEMEEPEVLSSFNPWAAQYLGARGPLAEPPNVWERVPYEIYFYLEDDDGEMELSYVVYYYPRPDDGQSSRGGYLYLPGSGEPYYAINAGLIMSAKDGKWFNAEPAWEAAVHKALASAAGEVPAGNAVRAGVAPWIVLLLGAAVAGAVLLVRIR